MSTTSTTAIDLTPILTAAIEAIATVLAAILVPLLWAGWTWLQNHSALSKIKISDAQHAKIDDLLSKALGYGISTTAGAAESLVTSGHITVDLHSQVASQAAAYAFSRFPDILRAQGLTTDSVTTMILARIGMIAASSATAPTSMPEATSAAPAVR